MTGRRQYSDKYSIPENPTWVEFERSDGDQNNWPTHTVRIVDRDGHVNFMRPVPLDEPGVSAKWQVEVGAALAVLLKWPEGQSYVLKTWPAGYAMFDHNKGPASAPRHDIYLFGSKGRYRSVPEFIPHAFWLKSDPTLDRSNCQCKYCSKKSQREITSTMTFLPQARHTVAGGSPGPSRTPKSYSKARGKARELPQRAPHRPYVAVQKAPRPTIAPMTMTGVPQHPVLRERNSDLRAAYYKSSMCLKRWFREGELLWCHLDPPIRSGRGEDVCIRFWPGLVQDVKMKSDAIPREVASSPKEEGEIDEDGEEDGEKEVLPWTIRQSTLYKMKLLAVSHSYTIPDEKVLPYQAYAPRNELLSEIKEISPVNLNISAELMAQFNPCPSLSSAPEGTFGSGAKFEDAVAPYSLAIQIAAKLSGYWCLTDEWEFKYTLPVNKTPTNGVPAETMQPTPSSSSMMLANLSSMLPEPNLSTTRVPGPSVPPSQTLVQTRYEGLWWGAERIWMDELVRLKVSRKQFAPEGTPDIYPPAGPSQKTLEYNSKVLPDGYIAPVDLNATGRGLFLRLDGLSVVDVPREDGAGTRKDCRANGMLYELADEDWPDPFEEEHKNFAMEKEKQRLAELSVSNIDGSTSSRPLTPNDAVSRPVSASPYPLPQPPTGFKFRPILPPGHEISISLTLISGRYYPSILMHPLLQSTVQAAFANPLEEGGLHGGSHLWSLEGLVPGYFNAVDPSRAKGNRVIMLRDADSEARMVIEEACTAAREGDTQKMDVDDSAIVDLSEQDELMLESMEVDRTVK